MMFFILGCWWVVGGESLDSHFPKGGAANRFFSDDVPSVHFVLVAACLNGPAITLVCEGHITVLMSNLTSEAATARMDVSVAVCARLSDEHDPVISGGH